VTSVEGIQNLLTERNGFGCIMASCLWKEEGGFTLRVATRLISKLLPESSPASRRRQERGCLSAAKGVKRRGQKYPRKAQGGIGVNNPREEGPNHHRGPE